MRQKTDAAPCRIDTPGTWMSAIIVACLISLFREPNRAFFVEILKRRDYLGVILSSSALNGGGRID
jgi:hypothetical protein